MSFSSKTRSVLGLKTVKKKPTTTGSASGSRRRSSRSKSKASGIVIKPKGTEEEDPELKNIANRHQTFMESFVSMEGPTTVKLPPPPGSIDPSAPPPTRQTSLQGFMSTTYSRGGSRRHKAAARRNEDPLSSAESEKHEKPGNDNNKEQEEEGELVVAEEEEQPASLNSSTVPPSQSDDLSSDSERDVAPSVPGKRKRVVLESSESDSSDSSTLSRARRRPKTDTGRSSTVSETSVGRMSMSEGEVEEAGKKNTEKQSVPGTSESLKDKPARSSSSSGAASAMHVVSDSEDSGLEFTGMKKKAVKVFRGRRSATNARRQRSSRSSSSSRTSSSSESSESSASSLGSPEKSRKKAKNVTKRSSVSPPARDAIDLSDENDCPICGDSDWEMFDGVQCDRVTCGKWFHTRCIGLDSKKARSLPTWICLNCKRKSEEIAGEWKSNQARPAPSQRGRGERRRADRAAAVTIRRTSRLTQNARDTARAKVAGFIRATQGGRISDDSDRDESDDGDSSPVGHLSEEEIPDSCPEEENDEAIPDTSVNAVANHGDGNEGSDGDEDGGSGDGSESEEDEDNWIVDDDAELSVGEADEILDEADEEADDEDGESGGAEAGAGSGGDGDGNENSSSARRRRKIERREERLNLAVVNEPRNIVPSFVASKKDMFYIWLEDLFSVLTDVRISASEPDEAAASARHSIERELQSLAEICVPSGAWAPDWQAKLKRYPELRSIDEPVHGCDVCGRELGGYSSFRIELGGPMGVHPTDILTGSDRDFFRPMSPEDLGLVIEDEDDEDDYDPGPALPDWDALTERSGMHEIFDATAGPTCVARSILFHDLYWFKFHVVQEAAGRMEETRASWLSARGHNRGLMELKDRFVRQQKTWCHQLWVKFNRLVGDARGTSSPYMQNTKLQSLLLI